VLPTTVRTERLKMTINGEPVAEIDIKASFLTVYHAMVKQPLKGSGDPYTAVAGFDRTVVKLWTTVSFGNSKPATRWPPKAAGTISCIAARIADLPKVVGWLSGATQVPFSLSRSIRLI
jgi:hypothetical protein